MNHKIQIPRVLIERFLLNKGFQRGPGNLKSLPDSISFFRPHHKDQRLTVTIRTTVPFGGTHTSKSDRKAIEVTAQFVNKDHQATHTLYRTSILRVNSIQTTLQRILEAAREAYKACNEYYKRYYSKFYHDTHSIPYMTLPESIKPAPQMVSNFTLGYIRGLRAAADLIKNKSTDEAYEYADKIRQSLFGNFGNTYQYNRTIRATLSLLINDHVLRIEDQIKKHTPEVQ